MLQPLPPITYLSPLWTKQPSIKPFGWGIQRCQHNKGELHNENF